MRNTRVGLTHAQVAQAAEICFKRFGVHRTSMVDVAEAVGVSRQTLYRLFDSRTMLLEFIANKRIIKLGKKLTSQFKQFETLEVALIEGSIIALESRHSDPLLEEIFAHSDDHDFEQFRFRGSPEIQSSMLGIWAPLIDQARSEGRLRPGLSNKKVVEWIRNIHAVVSLRDDYSVDDQRQIFRDFLVPSLLIDAIL